MHGFCKLSSFFGHDTLRGTFFGPRTISPMATKQQAADVMMATKKLKEAAKEEAEKTEAKKEAKQLGLNQVMQRYEQRQQLLGYFKYIVIILVLWRYVLFLLQPRSAHSALGQGDGVDRKFHRKKPAPVGAVRDQVHGNRVLERESCRGSCRN